MHAIGFANDTKKHWDSEKVSEVLRIIVRSLAVKFDGLVITCLVRDKDKNKSVNGVANSKHVPSNNRSDKCEAADFMLINNLPPSDLLNYCKAHFRYVDVIYHDKGSGKHYHLEVDTPKALNVEIT